MNSTVKSFEITNISESNMAMEFKVTFPQPYFVAQLTLRPDYLYIHMKYWMLDTNGQIPDENEFYRGMILTDHNYSDEDQIYGVGNHTFVRIFNELCILDKGIDKSWDGGFPAYKGRLNILANIVIQ